MFYSHRGKPPITIDAEELNGRVRDGNGCDLFAIITGHDVKKLREKFLSDFFVALLLRYSRTLVVRSVTRNCRASNSSGLFVLVF